MTDIKQLRTQILNLRPDEELKIPAADISGINCLALPLVRIVKGVVVVNKDRTIESWGDDAFQEINVVIDGEDAIISWLGVTEVSFEGYVVTAVDPVLE